MDVKEISNEFIRLSDGTRLAARIWLPAEANETNKVPAIFEFLPYRKRDGTVDRDEINYTHFAKNGYAGVRVDMRGCGDSEGDIQDEYVRQEQLDGLEVINWVANRPWCTGDLGMMGISWGGFNALQIAYERPQALKAIISICFTDDRYSDDIHFKGGAMLMDNIGWAAQMEALNMLPPDPLISENWLKVWMDRLQSAPNLSATWLSHQTRDAFWKHGSICEDYSRIEIPTMLIGGLADGYTDTVVRTLNNLNCEVKGLIGPWVHLYPNIAVPEPRWGFCDEAVKWWNQHLKGIKPPNPSAKLTVFVQDVPEIPVSQSVEGKWVIEPKIEICHYFLAERKLGEKKGDELVDICSVETLGLSQGSFFPVNLQQLPRDQNADDKLSVYFETESFSGSSDFVGYVNLEGSVCSSEPIASLFIRLCVVSPTGQSRQIAYSAFNLNHDDNQGNVIKLKSKTFQQIKVLLGYISETVRPGYKLRLCFSTSLFPMFVPNPKRTTLTLDLKHCLLQMPYLKSWKPYPFDVPLTTLEKPQPATLEVQPASSRNSTIDTEGEGVVITLNDTGLKVFTEHGLGIRKREEVRAQIHQDDPTSFKWSADITQQRQRKSENWYVDTFYKMEFTCDTDNFYTDVTRKCKLNDETVFEERHSDTVPRMGN